MLIDWPAVISRVKAALKRRGRSDHDADDLVQEAWVRLAVYQRYNPVAQPEAFLMRAALNLSIDAHRATTSHGEQLLLEDVVVIDGQPGAEDVLLGRERLARLSECVAQLDDLTRAILLAHRLEGLSYQQISRQHGISISTVHKHLGKALLLIRDKMKGWYP